MRGYDDGGFKFVCSSDCRVLCVRFCFMFFRITYRCRNTLQDLLTQQHKQQSITYNRNGVYSLKCNVKYIGQTSRSLKLRYQENTDTSESKNNFRQMLYIFCKTNKSTAPWILPCTDKTGHQFLPTPNMRAAVHQWYSFILFTIYIYIYIFVKHNYR
jgi:hypothetical protein